MKRRATIPVRPTLASIQIYYRMDGSPHGPHCACITVDWIPISRG
jgi:hypothetical protein